MPRAAGQEPLTRERILEIALRLIDEDGMEGLSMRRLGSILGCDPMAIYHHLENKEEVLSGVVQKVFSEMSVPRRSGEWKPRVRRWAQAYRAVARAHPNLVLEIVAHPEAVAVAAAGANESLYEALEAGGLPPRSIVLGAGVIVDYVNGFVLAEATGVTEQPGAEAHLRAELEAPPANHVSVQLRALSRVTAAELREQFAFGVEVILAGLETMEPRDSEISTRRARLEPT